VSREPKEKARERARKKREDFGYRDKLRFQARAHRLKNQEHFKALAKKRSDGIPKIYFVQVESGPIKIGFTIKKIRSRLHELQGGNHETLHLLGLIQPATKELELQLHRRFEAHWIRGEWFRPVPELLQFILTSISRTT
jgi:hypothetical protein